MLKFQNVKKTYYLDKNNSVVVFNDLNLTLDDTGFTAILGPSGCGKTTMLNIIGGLDRYDSGDLFVDGVSTKKFKDSDWDTYRNRKIGTVFQSYNLIPHLSLLANVELAMTLSGASLKYRKKKSIKALKRVGLGDMINKKPNQLSGGQMQRVAIARAIVNEPSIILADEPTGALDSKTSIQVMDILKELSKDRLVIIVTHNEELANAYATRIIKMVDGEIIDDKRVSKNEISKKKEKDLDTTIDLDHGDLTLVDSSFAEKVNNEINKKKKLKKNSSMSFTTALNISSHNIMTKKGRTILTSVASSFGIIGVALVLSLTNGFGNYVDRAERESLSQFPIAVERTSVTETLMSNPHEKEKELEAYPSSTDIIVQKPVSTTVHINDINKDYIDYVAAIDPNLVSSVKFNYSVAMNPITLDESGNAIVLSTSSTSILGTITGSSGYWNELTGSEDFIRSQYDIIGKFPSNSDELLISVDKYNRVSYNTMKALGYDLSMDASVTSKKFSFEDIMKKDFKVYSYDDLYVKKNDSNVHEGYFLKSDADVSKLIIIFNKLSLLTDQDTPEAFKQISELLDQARSMFNSEKEERPLDYFTRIDGDELKSLFSDTSKGRTLKVVGIMRPKDTTQIDLMGYGIYYTPELTSEILKLNKDTAIGKEIKSHCYIKDIGIMNPTYISSIEKNSVIDINTYLNQRLSTGTDQSITSITIYPKSFKEKSKIISYLDRYNELCPDNEVKYTDLSSMLISSIGDMINIISIVLICFAAIALVTSSVMMSIIMYTSVLERTKEIGILRAIGARKKDVSRLFRAETVIIGAISGIIGIIVTYILCIPINKILSSIYPTANIGSIAFLHPLHALLLVLISMFLTFLSGLIPARIASKKDAVVCLRSE